MVMYGFVILVMCVHVGACAPMRIRSIDLLGKSLAEIQEGLNGAEPGCVHGVVYSIYNTCLHKIKHTFLEVSQTRGKQFARLPARARMSTRYAKLATERAAAHTSCTKYKLALDRVKVLC